MPAYYISIDGDSSKPIAVWHDSVDVVLTRDEKTDDGMDKLFLIPLDQARRVAQAILEAADDLEKINS